MGLICVDTRIMGLMMGQNIDQIEFEFYFARCKFCAVFSMRKNEFPYKLLIAASQRGSYFSAVMEVKPYGELWISDEGFEMLKKFLSIGGTGKELKKEDFYRAILKYWPNNITKNADIAVKVMMTPAIIESKNLGIRTDEFIRFGVLPNGKRPTEENLALTRKYFGHDIEMHCRQYNISSYWRREKSL